MSETSIIGTTNAEDLYGNAGDNFFDGLGAPAGSHDKYTSYGGDDTFFYKAGYGDLVINNFSGVNHFDKGTLRFDASVSESGLSYSRGGNANLDLLIHTAEGSTITVKSCFGGNGANGLKQVVFEGGATYDWVHFATRLATSGTAAADNMYGTQNTDVFDGQGAPSGGHDWYVGNGGDDVFVYGAGYGDLRINNLSVGNHGNDKGTLLMKDAVAADVLFARVDNDLVVSMKDGSGAVTVEEAYASDQNHIKAIEFADGSVMQCDRFLDLGLAPVYGDGNAQDLYGSYKNELFDGKGAPAGSHDKYTSYGGDDTFFYKAGYGDLVINNFSGVNHFDKGTLRFDASVSESGLSYSRGGNANLDLLIHTAEGSTITVKSCFGGNGSNGLKQVVFEGGATYDWVNFATRLATSGTAAADNMYGTQNTDVFDGQGAPSGGHDWYVSNGGDDVFVYRANYGDLHISNLSVGNHGDKGTLLMKDVAAADVHFARVNNDLLLTMDDGSGAVTVEQAFYSESNQIKAVEFADGSVLGWTEIVGLATTPF